jgi:hypothetical protein
VDFGVPLITNIQLAQRFVEAIARKSEQDLAVRSWAEHQSLQVKSNGRSFNSGLRTNERESHPTESGRGAP